MPRSAWFVLLLAGMLALAGCAAPPKPAAPPPPPPAAEPAPPAEVAPAAPTPATLTDRQFVDLALSAGALQVGIGRLAEGKAASPTIRLFGRRLVFEHTREVARLNLLARYLKLTLAPATDKPPPELLIATGTDFDAEFLPVETQALADLLALYNTAATSGLAPFLRRYVHDTTPPVQRQLREVQAIGMRATR